MALPQSLIDLLSDYGRKRLESYPITNGLIHQTFRITIDQQPFLLQSINQHIFPKPEGLIENHLALCDHFETPNAPFSHPLARPLRFPDGNWIYRDETQQPWRITTFITDTRTTSSVKSPEQARDLSDFFARFTNHASSIDVSDWHIPLPGFHDLKMRYEQFRESVQNDRAGRCPDAKELIDAIQQRRHYIEFYNRVKADGDFRIRMMHHDAKLSNVLIDQRSNAWLCPIDLDTVMPGYFFSDLGDMIRSICNGSEREYSPAAEVHFRSDLFEALLEGYRSGMAGSLSTQEEKYLDIAGLLMTYMQTIRFLSDHLNGDVYYQTTLPNQNAARAWNQFTLLDKMEAYLQQRGRLSV